MRQFRGLVGIRVRKPGQTRQEEEGKRGEWGGSGNDGVDIWTRSVFKGKEEEWEPENVERDTNLPSGRCAIAAACANTFQSNTRTTLTTIGSTGTWIASVFALSEPGFRDTLILRPLAQPPCLLHSQRPPLLTRSPAHPAPRRHHHLQSKPLPQCPG